MHSLHVRKLYSRNSDMCDAESIQRISKRCLKRIDAGVVLIEYIPDSSWNCGSLESLIVSTKLDASAPALQARSKTSRVLDSLAAHGPHFSSHYTQHSMHFSHACTAGHPSMLHQHIGQTQTFASLTEAKQLGWSINSCWHTHGGAVSCIHMLHVLSS